ncbi:MAG TPA: amidohydrolase family protein [Xanthobacteraceae bacterium]|jgi:cytosine deaminase|nr:amidohydrolase family protein [Xanthobacteraceae bacterium]
MPDIIIRNGRLRHDRERPVDIAIEEGKIREISQGLSTAATEIDAGGNLVTPSFVNPHMHLCKVWTLPMMSEEALNAYQKAGMSGAAAAIALASEVKKSYHTSWIIKNARRAVALAALYGTTHMRAFADVDSKAKLEAVKALIALRDEFRGIVDIQVVAFAQDGIVKDPGTDKLMQEAMELGADVVGGIPWIEKSPADMQTHVEACFDLAASFGKDVSMLLDDSGDPNLRTLEMMAREAIKRGWHGRALAHHCRAMSAYPDDYLQGLIKTLHEANVAVVSNPHTGPLHAKIPELLASGITVCLGQDDISDAYYPFGRNAMLEVAFLASHLLWMMSRSEMETLYDMITVNPAKALHIADYGIHAGATANLVVLNQSDIGDALRFHSEPRAVISHGCVVDLQRMRDFAFGGA